MTLLQYCQILFLKDLGSLEFKNPNSHQTLCFSRQLITPTKKKFGGSEWENMENYLSKINVDEHFNCESEIFKRIVNSIKYELNKR